MNVSPHRFPPIYISHPPSSTTLTSLSRTLPLDEVNPSFWPSTFLRLLLGFPPWSTGQGLDHLKIRSRTGTKIIASWFFRFFLQPFLPPRYRRSFSCHPLRTRYLGARWLFVFVSSLFCVSLPRATTERGHKSFGIATENKIKSRRSSAWRRRGEGGRRRKKANSRINTSAALYGATLRIHPHPLSAEFVACVPCALLTQPPENVNARPGSLSPRFSLFYHRTPRLPRRERRVAFFPPSGTGHTTFIRLIPISGILLYSPVDLCSDFTQAVFLRRWVECTWMSIRLALLFENESFDFFFIWMFTTLFILYRKGVKWQVNWICTVRYYLIYVYFYTFD